MSKRAYVRFYDEEVGPGLPVEERYDLICSLNAEETLKVVQTMTQCRSSWFSPDEYVVDPETCQVYRISLWNCLPDPERELAASVSDEDYVPEKDRILSYADPLPEEVWKRLVSLSDMASTVFMAWLEKGRK